jgi:hypothetical protein
MELLLSAKDAEDFAEERKGRLVFATFAENFAFFEFKSLC